MARRAFRVPGFPTLRPRTTVSDGSPVTKEDGVRDCYLSAAG